MKKRNVYNVSRLIPQVEWREFQKAIVTIRYRRDGEAQLTTSLLLFSLTMTRICSNVHHYNTSSPYSWVSDTVNCKWMSHALCLCLVHAFPQLGRNQCIRRVLSKPSLYPRGLNLRFYYLKSTEMFYILVIMICVTGNHNCNAECWHTMSYVQTTNCHETNFQCYKSYF